MWGAAYRDGRLLTDVVQVTATTQRGRAEIPLVGQQRLGYKPTRNSSEGSIQFQKVDSGWELDVYNAMTLDVQALRAARDSGQYGTLDGTFDLLLKHDDPHAFGRETWMLKGCMIWQLDVGINNTDDFLSKELPLTFDEALPQETFRVVDGIVTKVNSISA